MRQQQMASREREQPQQQQQQAKPAQPKRPTSSPQEEKKATRPVVPPSASSKKENGDRNLDDFPLALHEVVELLTAVLQSVDEKSFAESVYVETQLFSVEHSSADGGSDSLTNIRRSPKTMMKVFGSKAKHLCVTWNADSFTRFLSSVSNYIDESEKVASLVTAIDDRMDLEIISSICF